MRARVSASNVQTKLTSTQLFTPSLYPLYTPLVFGLELSFISVFQGPLSNLRKLICGYSLQPFLHATFYFCLPSFYRSHNLSLLFWPSTPLPTSPLFYFFHPLPLSPPHPTPPFSQFFSSSCASWQALNARNTHRFARLKVKLHLSLHFSCPLLHFVAHAFLPRSCLSLPNVFFQISPSLFLLITIVQSISRSTHLLFYLYSVFYLFLFLFLFLAHSLPLFTETFPFR